MSALAPMDAVVVRALISELQAQTRATRDLTEAVKDLVDAIGELRGKPKSDRPIHFEAVGAMGENGR